MSVVLVNGDGNPAVHASQDADLLGGIGGQETGILDINDKFAATIADANTVEISSGVCITKEGRRIQIDVGDVEEIVVPTGSQGTTKYYIIGFHLYTDGSGNQLAETFIDEVASPSATITEKMFKDGETEVYVSLYRITRNGLNLEGLTLILPEIGSLAGGGIIGNTDISGIGDGTVTGAISQINTDLSDLATTRSKLGAKNLIPYPYYRPSGYTSQGMTATYDEDGVITVNKVAGTSAAHFGLYSNNTDYFLKPNTSYILSLELENAKNTSIYVSLNSRDIAAIRNKASGYYEYKFTTGATFTNYLMVGLYFPNTDTETNAIVKPMIRLATDHDSTYQPYAKSNRELTTDLSGLNDYTVNTETIIGVLKPSNKNIYRKLIYIPSITLSSDTVIDATLKYNDITALLSAKASYKGSAGSFETLNWSYGSQRSIYINNNGISIGSTVSQNVTELYMEVIYLKD